MDKFQTYAAFTNAPSTAPVHWAESYTNKECTLHQLSPYIGKLKSVIARDLISKYSKPGNLVVDMFCGSGTVPLEAARLGRRVFASDASKYAITLTKGKLSAPVDLDEAFNRLERVLCISNTKSLPELREIPKWVRGFFHPRTLTETLRLVRVLKHERLYFLLGSLLGILHHQRPGFLSFPASHLVPYLCSTKFPKAMYPELYKYRSIESRLKAKVERVLKRTPEVPLPELVNDVRQSSAKSVNLPNDIDCVVTSPPYMNALDYERDNRLRLWFLSESYHEESNQRFATLKAYKQLMDSLAKQLDSKMRQGGYCVFVVGEQIFRGSEHYPSEILARSFLNDSTKFELSDFITDVIPDIRRSRRNAAGVKQENILVFRKI